MFTFLLALCSGIDTSFCECDRALLGDGICNPECMTFDCAFDTSSTDILHPSLTSDCYDECIEKTNCTAQMLNN